MFARVARPAVLASQNAFPASRHMATLREIEGRLKSVKNIEKITKTMKIVASTRLTGAQRAMVQARSYGHANDELFKRAETGTETSSEKGPKKVLYVTVSSDKGLCGGVHSQLSRFTRRRIDEAPSDQESTVVVVGDKSKAQLGRLIPEQIALSFNQIGKEVPTFEEAQVVTDQILAQEGLEFDKVEIIHNVFKTMVSYEPGYIEVYPDETLKSSPKFASYEVEDDVLVNLKEFNLANAIYWALVEGHACEISARQSAMENASKNAGEMIDRFNMLYNRTRQAVITNDLVDIITGASAQEG